MQLCVIKTQWMLCLVQQCQTIKGWMFPLRKTSSKMLLLSLADIKDWNPLDT